ncbi:MAG: DUF1456 family protein [Gammaproteobacteria bacterium]|nr:DUF1456 family protein [Gammaproteobacteria bacterium]
MINNLVLRRLRYALNLRESEMVKTFAFADYVMKPAAISDLLKKELEAGFVECTDVVLERFLDGLIIQRRGVKEGAGPYQPSTETVRLNNNIILKKLRIALELHEKDMLEIMKIADFKFTKSELGAFFRNRNHRNYKPCGDQMMRNFLMGVCEKYRPGEDKKA